MPWRLGQLLQGMATVPQPLQQISIESLADDSRRVRPGALFVALSSDHDQARCHIDQARQRGGTVVVCEPDIVRADPDVVVMAGLRHRWGQLVSRFYQEPSAALDLIAVTGTDGKSTVAWLVASALEWLEGGAAVLGTVENRMMAGGRLFGVPTHTTPPPLQLQQLLAEVQARSGRTVVLEASSHGIDQQRLSGCRLRTAVLTQLGRYYLDYHGTLEAYRAAKRALFQHPGLESAVVNLDDDLGRELLRRAPPLARVIDYSLQDTAAGLYAELHSQHPGGMALALRYGEERAILQSPLLGRFNGYNLLAAAGVLLLRGHALQQVADVLGRCSAPPGRMEQFRDRAASLPHIVVDYAHTAGALEAALQALRAHLPSRSGKLWVVFGCGGERDRGKRSQMGAVAERGAERVVITSDNPRAESSKRILAEILAGMRAPEAATVIEERREAIYYACGEAAAEDVVLIAGKGHEQWQEVDGKFQPFCDRALVRGITGSGMITTVGEVAEAVGGRLVGARDARFSGVSTDSRTLHPGELFVALDGPHFDGGRFLPQALERGAQGAVLVQSRSVALPQVVVPDSRHALGRLATAWRRQFDIPVVAITGSNGKTTVKEMVAAILRQLGPGVATQGNLNNEIGVPLTLLRIGAEDRWVIIEMGASGIGEIAALCQMAQPTVAIVNNAGSAHLGGFGSLQRVVEAKGEIYRGLIPGGVAVINRELPQQEYWRGLVSQGAVHAFGYHPEGVEMSGEVALESPFLIRMAGEEVEVALPLSGRHNRINALAAAALAWNCGATLEQIRTGLEQMVAVPGRLQWLTGASGARLIDDSYNASPESVESAIEVLAAEPGERVAVIGDMGELGASSGSLHYRLGEVIAAAGIDRLYALGEQSRKMVAGYGQGANWFDSPESLLATLRPTLHNDMVILIKGSRFMKMERIVEQLQGDRSREFNQP